VTKMGGSSSLSAGGRCGRFRLRETKRLVEAVVVLFVVDAAFWVVDALTLFRLARLRAEGRFPVRRCCAWLFVSHVGVPA